MAMVTRRFGRTGIDMPVMSTGGMRYQDGWKDKPFSEIADECQKNLQATIERSLELGINHIETARGYGPSERQLGKILPRMDRDSLIVQTKIGPAEDAAKFTENFHDSLGRLQLDHVDLLAIHGINDDKTLHDSVKPGGCLEACFKLREQGKCKWIGFSTHGPLHILLKAIEHGRDASTNGGDHGFDYINLHWYYIFQRNWPAIEAATRHDMGVFIISPTDKGGKLYDPPDKLRELCDPLHPIVFNDLWCLCGRPEHSQVHTLSIGSAKPSDYDEHIEAVELMDKASELLPPIEKRLAQAMLDAVGVAEPEAHGKGLPISFDAPGDINFEIMLWLRNLALGWDMTDYAKMRFNLLGNGSHWFHGRKGEEIEQIDKGEIRAAIADSPYAQQIPGWLDQVVDMLGGEEVKRLSES